MCIAMYYIYIYICIYTHKHIHTMLECNMVYCDKLAEYAVGLHALLIYCNIICYDIIWYKCVLCNITCNMSIVIHSIS